MPKVLAETTKPIMLLEPTSGQMLGHDRPYVIDYSSFFESRTGKGEIRIIEAELPDTATDKEFEECLKASDGDVALAVASFISIVKPETKPEPKPKAKSSPATKV